MRSKRRSPGGEVALGCKVNRRQAREGALGCKVNCVTREDATAMTTLITLLIGMFIGWNLPQPDWARAIQDKVVSLFQSLINK